MDLEFLSDYQENELKAIGIVAEKIRNGTYNAKVDKYPYNGRLANVNLPIARATLSSGSIWAQVPFSGSLLVPLMPLPEERFEDFYFPISEMNDVIAFAKTTGRIQFILNNDATDYAGLEYLNPLFDELKPPLDYSFPWDAQVSEEYLDEAKKTFEQLIDFKFIDFLQTFCYGQGIPDQWPLLMRECGVTFFYLYINKNPLLEDVIDSIITNPAKAYQLLYNYRSFIYTPTTEMLADQQNLNLKGFYGQVLPKQPSNPDKYFPIEIGSFLFKKMTYKPEGLSACKELLDQYAKYDLHKVQTSLNEAIRKKHPDNLKEPLEDFSTVLDNVWADKTIPNRTIGIRLGVPFAVTALGELVKGLSGVEGLLAELGFKIGETLIEATEEVIAERLARFMVPRYQLNIYDFKQEIDARELKVTPYP